ncbi:MAG: ABC transporter ATP-binding protein [Acholeplasmataceae bacterium]|jgi:ATP-binding cassette subfamily B multidrug efflux pump
MRGRGGRRHSQQMHAINFKGSLRRLIKYLKNYIPIFIFIGLLSVVGALATVVGPLISGQIINGIKDAYLAASAVPNQLVQINQVTLLGRLNVSFNDALLILSIIYLFSAVLNYLNGIFISITIRRINYKLRNDLTAKFSRLPLKFFDKYTRGEVLSRVTNDVESLNSALESTLSEIFRGIFMIILITIMMFMVSWQLSLIIYFSIALSLVSSMFLVSKSRQYFRQHSRDIGRVNSHVEENYSGHLIVSAFNHQESGIKEFEEIADTLKRNSFKSQFISGIMWPVQIFFSNLSFILIALVGGMLVLSGQFEVGYIQTFVTYSRQINQPIMTIGSIANVLQTAAASSERIFELLDATEQEKENYPLLTEAPKGHVSFKNVHFSYVEGIEVIKDFSADIKPGQMVAIVGPTGAGKTTLVNLLMRFYDINSGEIKIDEKSIYEINRNEVRRQFAMVLQDTWIFEGTVYENISYGTPNVEIEAVKKAAKEAQIDRFIETLPRGYDYILQEDGENISQGQRQLITIARAILANRPMIILDEATSSVDTRTEQLIQDAMDRLTTSRTSFVIAHRLSTIKNADLILVLKEGNIVEQGTHESLLSMDGHYAELYYSQFDNNELATA